MPSISSAKYAKNDGTVRYSTTFYDHFKILDAATEEAFNKMFRNEQDESVVQQRRFFLMQHMIKAQCPQLGYGAVGAAMHNHTSQNGDDSLPMAMLAGLVAYLGKLAPRGNGRNTNARTVLRRALLVGVLSGVERGQYSAAARLLSDASTGVHMRVETIRQHARCATVYFNFAISTIVR